MGTELRSPYMRKYGFLLSLDLRAMIRYYRDTTIETFPEYPNRTLGACFIIATGQKCCGNAVDRAVGTPSKR